MTQTSDDLVELVRSLVVQIVDNPEVVEVTGSLTEEEDVLVEISVAEDDIGKVIGRQGRIIKAIRTLTRAAALQANMHVEVELA
jgi:uncharacterized protein